MLKYKVIHGRQEIEFPTYNEAESFRMYNGISIPVEEINEPDVAAPTTLDILEKVSENYIKFGVEVDDILTQKAWAKNTYLKTIGQPLTIPELQSLLNITSGLSRALRTGSLITSRDGLTNLKNTLSQYADIADFGIAKINTFLGV